MEFDIAEFSEKKFQGMAIFVG